MYNVLITTIVRNEATDVVAVNTAISQFETRREALDVEAKTNTLPTVGGVSYRAFALID